MGVIAKLTQAGLITTTNAGVAIAAINAGVSAVGLVALIGGGGLAGYIIKKAFQNGAKKVILSA